ncbi:hypothetical protein KFE25_000494 [Diacronema lutheri]|uniref:Uncharacterized protein n=1 Tax=Diacronema lutheri TaxID=2081491 RepID=A0A8J5XH70_DIALT|nr:hypothetical protein KFE25_000494 [Diacronema lutheri]
MENNGVAEHYAVPYPETAEAPATAPRADAEPAAPLAAPPLPAAPLAAPPLAHAQTAPATSLAAAPAAATAAPQPAWVPIAASAGASGSGSGLLRRGFFGITSVLDVGRKSAVGALGGAVSLGSRGVTTAVARGVPAAASAVRHVGKTLEGHKEQAMDAALRIAMERGLHNGGLRFVELLTDDEDMPAWARVRMRGAAIWLWAEVETEAMAAVLLENTFAARRARALELEQLEADAHELRCCAHPLSKLRAHILYALYPYDRSIWGQLRMPSFYPLMLLQLCPVYGVQTIFFLLLFLIRDKGDEFQLCQFILEFKGLQFVTVGAIGGLVAGAHAQWCATHGTCGERGLRGAPGQHSSFAFETGAFVLNMLLCWAAFVLLPLSKQKGALGAAAGDVESGAIGADVHVPSAPGGTASTEPRAPRSGRGVHGALRRVLARGKKLGTLLEPAEHVQPEKRLCCGCAAFHPRRGGVLRSLLLYDLASFALCCSAAGLACATTSGWVLRSWLSWVRVLYGLASLPFVPFIVPPLDRVLLHAKPTAYDRHGRCVAPLSLRDRQLRQQIRAAKTGLKTEATSPSSGARSMGRSTSAAVPTGKGAGSFAGGGSPEPSLPAAHMQCLSRAAAVAPHDQAHLH